MTYSAGYEIPTIADIKALNSSNLVPGYGRYCSDPAIADWYHWQATSTATENSPYILIPDDSPVMGRWFKLQQFSGVGAKVFRITEYSIPISSTPSITIPFEDEEYDDLNFWSALDPTKLTIPVTGRYSIHANIGFLPYGVGYRAIAIVANGSTVLSQSSSLPVGDFHYIETHTTARLNSGDYVELRAGQNSDIPLNIFSFGSVTKFWIESI